jgi:hypothetical protein
MLTRMLSVAAVTALALTAALSAGAAEEGRAVDMTAPLHDEFGRDARDTLEQGKEDPDCARCPPLTLGRACAHALFASFPDEQVAPDQKWARAVLATRIRDDNAAHLDADEIAVIKRLVGKVYGGIVLMQIYPMLDPNAKPPAVK